MKATALVMQHGSIWRKVTLRAAASDAPRGTSTVSVMLPSTFTLHALRRVGDVPADSGQIDLPHLAMNRQEMRQAAQLNRQHRETGRARGN